MNLKNVIKSIRIKLQCDQSKHPWHYYTWGSAFVDNLDDTFGLWSISSRECEVCGKHQHKLKNGWEDAKKKLTINDLQ